MVEQSPLHWKILPDSFGHPFLQMKNCVDDDCWSEAVRHWDTKAPRPDNRECHTNVSGLLPTDLTLAPRKPLSTKRVEELTLVRSQSKSRKTMSSDEYNTFTDVLAQLFSHNWRTRRNLRTSSCRRIDGLSYVKVRRSDHRPTRPSWMPYVCHH
jgi:hypothetical protein